MFVGVINNSKNFGNKKQAEKLESREMKEGWLEMMKDEWRMMKDEWRLMKDDDFKLLRGFEDE